MPHPQTLRLCIGFELSCSTLLYILTDCYSLLLEKEPKGAHQADIVKWIWRRLLGALSEPAYVHAANPLTVRPRPNYKTVLPYK